MKVKNKVDQADNLRQKIWCNYHIRIYGCDVVVVRPEGQAVEDVIYGVGYSVSKTTNNYPRIAVQPKARQ